MGAGVDADNSVTGIELEPDVLEFVEMLDIPIPPDRVFDHLFDAGLESDGKGRRRRLAGRIENRHADL